MITKAVALLSCSKSKRTEICEARLLYDKSTKFNLSLVYAQTLTDQIYILSAKHGLVSLNTRLAPYDETLIGKRKEEILAWKNKVIGQIKKLFVIEDTKFIILAGKKYVAPLQDELRHLETPLSGLRQGESLAQLKKLISNSIRS